MFIWSIYNHELLMQRHFTVLNQRSIYHHFAITITYKSSLSCIKLFFYCYVFYYLRVFIPSMINHVTKYSLSLNQIIWRTNFNYLAFMHHNDLVVVCYCVQTMSNRQNCSLFELLFNDSLNQLVCLHIHIRGGLV
jgi:hypothetical protein